MGAAFLVGARFATVFVAAGAFVAGAAFLRAAFVAAGALVAGADFLAAGVFLAARLVVGGAGGTTVSVGPAALLHWSTHSSRTRQVLVRARDR